jgi:hypothetical protein
MKPEAQELERDVEARLVKRCKENSWYCRKFVSPGYRSVPDRVVVAHGAVYFIELKAPGQVPRKDQAAEHAEIRANGVEVAVLDTRRAVDAWCAGIVALVSGGGNA